MLSAFVNIENMTYSDFRSKYDVTAMAWLIPSLGNAVSLFADLQGDTYPCRNHSTRCCSQACSRC